MSGNGHVPNCGPSANVHGAKVVPICRFPSLLRCRSHSMRCTWIAR